MDAWSATVNLGLATAIAVIFVAEARLRERRHNKERAEQTLWIQATFLETLEQTTQALATHAILQGRTLDALTAAARTNEEFVTLIRHGICPFNQAPQESTAAQLPTAPEAVA